MFSVLPDSKGCIEKVLYHHSPVRQCGKIVSEGIFRKFLEMLNRTGIKPMAYVLASYMDEDENESLKREADTWRNLLESLSYIDVEVKREFLSEPPYAQDICTVLESPKSSVIMAKSSCCLQFPEFISSAEELITSAGLEIIRLDMDYTLEGGYLQSTSSHLFYTDPKDGEIVKHFGQETLFIEDLINELLNKILHILSLSGITAAQLPTHVDLMFSFLERDNSFEVFYVDFRENTLKNPFLTYKQFKSLEAVFDEWDEKMGKLCKKLASHIKNARFHKVPGVLDFEKINMALYGVQGTAVLPYIYSGVNLLFHTIGGRDYAFYLKYPTEIEELNDLIFNEEIEKTLNSADITAIPISGDDEVTNFVHIRNSAGLRCLVKVLSRS